MKNQNSSETWHGEGKKGKMCPKAFFQNMKRLIKVKLKARNLSLYLVTILFYKIILVKITYD